MRTWRHNPDPCGAARFFLIKSTVKCYFIRSIQCILKFFPTKKITKINFQMIELINLHMYNMQVHGHLGVHTGQWTHRADVTELLQFQYARTAVSQFSGPQPAVWMPWTTWPQSFGTTCTFSLHSLSVRRKMYHRVLSLAKFNQKLSRLCHCYNNWTLKKIIKVVKREFVFLPFCLYNI